MMALLFPGQGAQSPAMFEAVQDWIDFGRRYEVVCDYTGTDVMREIAGGNTQLLDTNLFSSLLTILVSSVSLEILASRQKVRPAFLAGYSVGQWCAMYAAKMLTFEQLVFIAGERAKLMDECVTRQPSAMCAVIGIAEHVLAELVAQMRADNHLIFISNYNCFGQYSIAGALSAIELAEQKIRALKPKKLLRLPVAGGWHCPILSDAERMFAKVLADFRFRSPEIPVVDNVTGAWLPAEQTQLKANLARHISQPVYWERGMRLLLANGCKEFVEVGFGNNLTKFGFFIDRDVDWRAFNG